MTPPTKLGEARNFTGMNHSLDGLTESPSVAWWLQNYFPFNGVLHSRPAFVTGGLVSAAGAASGQGIISYIPSTTERIIAVSAGEIYDVSGTTWTRRVTTANLTTNSITLNSTGRVYMVQFGAYLIFSDGTNVPFRWDGAAGAGGLTSLTSCPVLFGQPVIYYAKLFGIKNSARDTIVWSEENDATTGYEAGGYTNRWRLTQTGGGPLYALAAENEQLVYFRASNIGAIRGAVGPAFTTTGVHDAIDLETGSTEPRGPIRAYDGFWFYDQQNRPCCLRRGEVEQLWRQMPASFGSDANSQPYRGTSGTPGYVSMTNLPGGIAVYPSLTCVQFWFQGTTSGAPTFDGPSGQLRCFFKFEGATIGAFGIHYTVTLEQTGDLYMLNTTSGVTKMLALTDLGRLGTLSPDLWGDGSAASNPIYYAVPGKMAADQTRQWFFDTLSIEAEREGSSGTSNADGFLLQYLTSNQPTMASMSSAVLVQPTVERHEQKAIGIAGYGRWVAPVVGVQFAASTANVPTHIYSIAVYGYPDADDAAMT